MSAQKDDRKPQPQLPLREIPGDYGLPLFGPIKDRLDFFYNQGRDNFFISRIQKHQSTVFRTNLPPGPFISSNPQVVALLDTKSFPVLLDNSKIDKRDAFVGTYKPSSAFNGGYRVCGYLDTSEPDHAALKYWFLSQLAARKDRVIPLFRRHLADLFLKLEDQLVKNGKVDFNKLSDQISFNFIFELFCDRHPSDTTLRTNGPKFATLWLLPQLSPLMTLGLPKFLNLVEDLLLHTVPFPALLVKPIYNKLYNVFWDSATSALDEAERLGIPRDEACHNLVFLVVFNAYGGMKVLFPALLKWVGIAGQTLHRQLRNEIRTVVKEAGGKVTLSALEKMTLTKSVVYEALRMEPPVPFSHGKAKKDMIVHSHDAAFVIKEGEMMFGYQPIVQRDPKVFENPDEFVEDRFVGEGEKLLTYLWWSLGRETENPTVDDKQCAGKDLVVVMNRIMLVEFFLRYDTFTADIETLLLGSKVTLKTLIKNASY